MAWILYKYSRSVGDIPTSVNVMSQFNMSAEMEVNMSAAASSVSEVAFRE